MTSHRNRRRGAFKRNWTRSFTLSGYFFSLALYLLVFLSTHAPRVCEACLTWPRFDPKIDLWFDKVAIPFSTALQGIIACSIPAKVCPSQFWLRKPKTCVNFASSLSHNAAVELSILRLDSWMTLPGVMWVEGRNWGVTWKSQERVGE